MAQMLMLGLVRGGAVDYQIVSLLNWDNDPRTRQLDIRWASISANPRLINCYLCNVSFKQNAHMDYV
jgi:hypothetical protein